MNCEKRAQEAVVLVSEVSEGIQPVGFTFVPNFVVKEASWRFVCSDDCKQLLKASRIERERYLKLRDRVASLCGGTIT
jgi:hypothetical protein